MANIEETSNNQSTTRKVIQVADDVNTVIVLGVAVVGLGWLAYDGVKFGIDKIKSKKSAKTEK